MQAMAAVDQHLTRRGDRIALLLTPPFDRSLPDPGYIKGYPPGDSPEWRPIYGRRHLVDLCVRDAGTARPCR